MLLASEIQKKNNTVTYASNFCKVAIWILEMLTNQVVQSRGQSYKTVYTLGRWKVKSLNCCLNEKEKCNPANMLGCCVLTLQPTKFVLVHYFHALGHACKFALRCKKFYRIGPWSSVKIRNGKGKSLICFFFSANYQSSLLLITSSKRIIFFQSWVI